MLEFSFALVVSCWLALESTGMNVCYWNTREHWNECVTGNQYICSV
uniref:Uncharacterized protein n=1 Tax=Arundo donax TaxID=35708 RepID=A0A0A9E5K4_ARUDO